MPKCVRVGDIIRVHRASCGTFKGYKTLSCNMGYSGAWCQFEGFGGSVSDSAPKEEAKAQSEIEKFYSPKKTDAE
jgi:hypothetical protein